MRRAPSTSTKRVLWVRLPSTLLSLKTLRPRSVRRLDSPVRKCQRAGSAVKCLAYWARTGGGAGWGSTGDENRLMLGVVDNCTRRICELIMGHGPGQVV